MSFTKTIKSSNQIGFVNELTLTEDQQTKDFSASLLKQRALSVVNTMSNLSMLKHLKELVIIKNSLDNKRVNGGLHYAPSIRLLKTVVGYDTMTEQQQTKINDYLNS